MKTVSINVFSYSELSEKAKEKAREAIDRLRNDFDWTSDDVSGVISEILCDEDLEKLKPSWSLSYCQGDGVAFSGWIELDRSINSGMFQYVLEACQKQDPIFTAIDLTGTEAEIDIRGNHTHEHSMRVRSIRCDDHELFEDVISEAILSYLRKVSIKCRDAGYNEIEFQSSEEYIVDFLEANEHLDAFLENGERFTLES